MNSPIYEVDDEKYQEISGDQLRRDMTKVLNKVLIAIGNSNDNFKSLLEENKGMIESFLSKLNEIREVKEMPEENGNEEMMNAMKVMSENIVSSLNSLEECVRKAYESKPTKWEFQITERNFTGFASKIIAIPK